MNHSSQRVQIFLPHAPSIHPNQPRISHCPTSALKTLKYPDRTRLLDRRISSPRVFSSASLLHNSMAASVSIFHAAFLLLPCFREESSPPDDTLIWKYEMLDSKAEARRAKSFRRKRMEIRKTKSFAKEKTYRNQNQPTSSSDECREFETKSAVYSDVSSKSDTSYGKVSLIGRRREMEDAITVELGFLNWGKKGYDFFGVYDGHGGCRVAQECSIMLHKIVLMSLGEENGEVEINWGKLMVDGFKKMDEEVNKYGAAVASTGSTAVVAVVGEDVVVVANCGDSRAVLSRGGASIALSDDHKPDRPDELERIEECGGRVINWNGQRVLGVLATSRSIGDQYLKPFVSTEPEVKVINRSDLDEFLILASDGLWDVVSNDLACQVTRRCLYPHQKLKRTSSTSFPNSEQEKVERVHEFDEERETVHESHQGVSKAAAMLAELAMARGSGDNISVIVVKLKSSGSRVSVSPPPQKREKLN